MFDFPESWVIEPQISRWIAVVVDWVVVNWDPVFDAINTGVLAVLVPLEDFLLWLPWWMVVLITGLVAWRIVDGKTAAMAMISLVAVSFLGLMELTMQTLSLVITSTLICVGFGLPLGILAAKSDRFDAVLRPVLDAMQTMPSFVYLLPAVMLFGLGKMPAVMATVIYAIPPMIRLTNLGIRQVDPEVVEAARAFGSTPGQILAKVQIPMALPTIMAGVNQCIMMALAMVIIAAYIGAKGLGVEVLNGIARLDVGRGLLGGLGIVVMAVIIDRISQGVAKPRRVKAV